MRVIHVVPQITNEASGPSYCVVTMCQALRDSGADTLLAVLDADNGSMYRDFVKTFRGSRFPRRLGFSSAMRRWLQESAFSGEVDIIHNNSLWLMPNVYPGWATQRTKVPLVVSPHGTLSRWAMNRSKWVKQVFWWAVQAPAIRHAACFHATAEMEYEDIRRAGFRQPVCIIPNGIDVPRTNPKIKSTAGPRRLLYFGRIHPVKGLDTLLRAWKAVAHRHPDWNLDIVGPDNGGYLRQLQAMACDLKSERVTFYGPLFGDQKIKAYQTAELYVLPTHSENFAMTVAEALAAGTPAIVTKGAPWGGLEQHGAGWWIEIGVDPLVASLDQALTCSSERLIAMGSAGREWMQKEYSWKRVSKMMLDTYQWICRGGIKPSWVWR